MNLRSRLVFALLAGWPALGLGEDGRGLRSLSLGYELIQVEGGYLRDNYLPGLDVRAETLVLGVDYALSERWSLSASLPFSRRRAIGFFSHDPSLLPAPFNRAPVLDDGRYHGSWQDWRIGLHHHREFGGWSVSPYLVAHIPSHDYPHFGNAAVGQNLWKLQLGGSVSYLLESAPLYWTADLSYLRVEQVLDINVDHWILDVSLGWLIAPSFGASVFVREKQGNGTSVLTFNGRRDERWYQHDRIQPLEYRVGGATFEWAATATDSLALTWSTMLKGYTVQNIDYSVQAQWTRYFD